MNQEDYKFLTQTDYKFLGDWLQHLSHEIRDLQAKVNELVEVTGHNIVPLGNNHQELDE